MKLAMLAVFATAVVVSAYTPPIQSAVFKPGEQYIYHYKGQVLSGLPKTSNQHSGLLIDSIVVLQFQQDYKVVMRMEKIKLFKINNKISTLSSELLPESELTHLTGEQVSVVIEHLVKPLKFRYEEGEVRDIEKETSDRFWSVNIKKGVLSLFQVTLKEKNSFSSESVDPTMSRVKSRNSYGSPSTPYWKLNTKFNSVYKVMETDVTGNCETKYSVISDKTHLSTSTSKLLVTAVRNYENCITKPFYIQGLFQGVHISSTEKDLIQPIVHTDYVITGDRNNFLVKEATLRGKYSFLANGLEGGDMSTHVVQHLTLKSTEPIRSPVRLNSPKQELHGLQMIIPQATFLPERKNNEGWLSGSSSRSSGELIGYRRRLQQEYGMERSYERDLEEEEESFVGERDDITSVVETKLSELVHCLYPVTDKKCSGFLLEISRIIRQANKPQLKALITRYLKGEESSSSENDYRKSEILLDILPTISSPDASKVLIELIREKLISDVRGTLLVKAMSLMVKPTPNVIKTVLDLYKELPKESTSTLSPKTMLRQTLLLSVGTLTHRLINVMRTINKPIPQIVTFIDTISSEFKRMLEETTSASEKILILKSMGNMGASETITTLKQITQDQNQPLKIRISAVFALRRLAKQFNKQVVPILLSVFMDVKEDRELRQGAFVVIINSNPSYTTLQMIAHRLRDEPHSQIRTLVYSSLINLAMHTSHEPEHKTLAKNARLIIKSIPPVRVGVHDSMSLFVNKFSEELDMGGAINLIKIKSKMSGLPEALIANLQGTLFGKHRRLLEVGVQGKSLEVILKKIFGPHGVLKEILKGEITLQDLFKPLTRPDLELVESKIRETLNKMMSELRSDEEPFGSSYIHLLGNELQYIMLNSQNIEEVVRKVTSFIPELFIKLTRGIKVDIIKSVSHIESLTIASPIGIPLSLNHTTAGIFKVEGHLKVNNLPNWSEMMNKFTLPLSKIRLDVDLKPVVDASHYVTLGVDLRWLAFGVGAEATIRATKPFKISTHLNPQDHSVSVKYFMPKQSVKMLHAKFTPITFVKFFPTTVDKLPFIWEMKEINIEKIVKTIPFEHKYPCSITGMELEARGLISLCGPTWCPTFIGKHEITLVASPISSVDFVHIKVKSLKSNLEFEGVPASRSTFELYEENEDEDEEVQNYRRHTRTSDRSMIESDEFEPIPVDQVFQNEPIKRQLLITLGPNTQQSPKIKTLVTWLMGRKYWKNQVNLQVVRNSHGETPAWKIHLNNVINPLVWYPEESFKGETEFLNKMHLIWRIRDETKEFKVKIIPGSPFDFTRELKQHRILTTDDFPEAEAQKYKYTLVVDLPPMTNKMLKYMTVAQDFMKYQLYKKVTTSIPTHPLNDKIIVAVELLPWWEQMNIIVKTPREDSYISAVPFYWNPFLPTNEMIKHHDVQSWEWYSKRSEGEEEPFLDTVPYTASPFVGGICKMDSKNIVTFDGTRFPIEPYFKFLSKGCPMAIVQDCSSHGLLTIKGRNDGKDFKWTVVVPKYELTWVGRYGDDSKFGSVHVNGEEMPLEITRPIVIRDVASGNSKPVMKFEKIGSHEVVFKLYEYGLTFTGDMKSGIAKYELSPTSMLQGQLCGLCGNYNQDQSDEFQMPYNVKITSEVKSFLAHNILPSETCDASKISSAQDDYCLKEATPLTIRRYDDQVSMTCTSENRLPHCAEGCRSENTKSVKVCFKCHAEEGRDLLRKTYLAPRWDTYESEIECEDYFHRVEVPTRCVPVY